VPYTVTVPVFEGPIDLLLHLVNCHEVDILDVPLTPIVDGFVRHVTRAQDHCAMDTLSEFVLVAAILVELKSQRLLPGPDTVEPEEELLGSCERDLLLARLLECRAYAAVADRFVTMFDQAARSFPRQAGLDEGFVVHPPDLLAGVTPERLAAAYLAVAAERPRPRLDLSHVTVDKVTVAEAVEELVAVLPHQGTTTFRALTAHLGTRIEIIVRFLALLELCKIGKVDLGQGETFGELQVTWIGEYQVEAPGLVGAAARSAGFDEYDG